MSNNVNAHSTPVYMSVIESVLRSLRREWTVEEDVLQTMQQRWVELTGDYQARLKQTDGSEPEPKKLKSDAESDSGPSQANVAAPPSADASAASSQSKSNASAAKDPNEESLSSLSDSEGEDTNFVTNNVVICQYEDLKRSKKKWRVRLRHGFVVANGEEFRFTSCIADLKRW